VAYYEALQKELGYRTEILQGLNNEKDMDLEAFKVMRDNPKTMSTKSEQHTLFNGCAGGQIASYSTAFRQSIITRTPYS
jgi:tRNA(Glu) U13 pseudouridine synthase TruD